MQVNDLPVQQNVSMIKNKSIDGLNFKRTTAVYYLLPLVCKNIKFVEEEHTWGRCSDLFEKIPNGRFCLSEVLGQQVRRTHGNKIHLHLEKNGFNDIVVG